MAQTWQMPPALTDYANQVLVAAIPNSMEALRTCHSGSSAPASPVAYMLWADTSAGWLKLRNASNTAWLKVHPLAVDNVLQLSGEGWSAASLSATKTDWLATAPRAGTVKRVVLLSSSASTSSSGNEWTFQVKKYPNSAPASPVNLCTAAPGTFTAVGGVGGGAEFVANKAWTFAPNQNATLLDGDVLELVATKLGTGTTLARFRAVVEIE